MRNRIIALLLACVMTVSLLPVSALAVEPSDTAAAQETTVITTAEEFAAMKSDGAYRLGADITVDAPYGKTFTGSLDGAYHTVTLALHVTADDTDASWGLFRALNGAAIRDLRLAGELAAAEDSPAKNVGALAGTVSGDTTVSGCRSEVQISVSSADSHVGGLLGSVTGRYAVPDRLRERGYGKGAEKRRRWRFAGQRPGRQRHDPAELSVRRRAGRCVCGRLSGAAVGAGGMVRRRTAMPPYRPLWRIRKPPPCRAGVR